MNKDEIIAKIKYQNFPAGSYVVFGSGPLAAAGIRLTRDIDIVVTDALYEELKQKGWQESTKPNGDYFLGYDMFEAFTSWKFGEYDPKFTELLANANSIDGVPFVGLQDVKKWKIESGRDRDIQDIQLIDEDMTKTQRKGITLIGMPAGGKSTIGRRLSEMLGMPMLDVDRWMEEQEGMLLPELLRTKGADYVLALESSCIRDHNLRETIVSPPGSIIYNDVLQPLQQQTHIVYLKVPFHEIESRLAADTVRQGEIIGIKEKGLDGLFTERTPLYEKWAEYTIDCEEKTVQEITDEVIETLEYR